MSTRSCFRSRSVVALIAAIGSVVCLFLALVGRPAPSAGATLPPQCTAQPPANGSQVVTCTYHQLCCFDEDSFAVPSGITSLAVAATGGGGAATGQGSPGRGAVVGGTLDVVPGETLYIEVAYGNGGGAYSSESDLRTCSVASSCPPLGGPGDARLVVAGGGGGAATNAGGGAGGDAGTLVTGSCAPGSNGSSGTIGPNVGGGGQAGGCAAGGAGGALGGTTGQVSASGAAGSAGTGGLGSASRGGTGGAGYFGGGGGGGAQSPGSGGGGGGGSSFAGPRMHNVTMNLVPLGSAPSIVLTYTITAASIVISPRTPAPVQSGQTTAFTVEAFDSSGNDLGDVTNQSTFTLSGGACSGASCTAGTPGDQTVSATHNGHSDSVPLHVDAVSVTNNVTTTATATVTASSTVTATATATVTATQHDSGPVTARTTTAYPDPVTVTDHETVTGAGSTATATVTEGVAAAGSGDSLSASPIGLVRRAHTSPFWEIVAAVLGAVVLLLLIFPLRRRGEREEAQPPAPLRH